MLIGFLGDVHGRVFHALAALATCQAEIGRPFDLLVQVGDMGAFPDQERMEAMDPTTRVHLELAPEEADFRRLLAAAGERATNLRRLRERMPGAVHFVRGDHEDFDWLNALPLDATSGTATVDDFGTFRYVPDGTVLEAGGAKLVFLGGAEELSGPAGIDREAYDSVMELESGSIDVLVTHQGPYGTSIGSRGEVQGSMMMTELIASLQPRFHVAGHAHTLVEGRTFGRTKYLGLAALAPSPRWEPEERSLKAGCIGVLDTETWSISAVTNSWLTAFQARPFDFDAWCERTLAAPL